MTVTFVTALYIIPNNEYRDPVFYLDKIEYLIQSGVPVICYLDKTLETQGEILKKKYPNLTIPEYVALDKSWVPNDVRLPGDRNKQKDTIDYFCIQLSKLKCLTDASKYATTTHTAWIDAGIFYMFNDKEKAKSILNEIANASWPNKILAPGGYNNEEIKKVWEINNTYFFLDYIFWNYLGSFLLGDKTLWLAAYEQQTAVVTKHLPRLAWEVNYWSQMDVFTWYRADHNISMLENVLQFRQF